MSQTPRFPVRFWAAFLGCCGALAAQQSTNPNDQYTTLGRRATTINQQTRQQSVPLGTINNQNNTANNTDPNTGTGGPTPASYTQPEENVNPDTDADVDFARRLVEHGTVKAELGKLAVQKGGSEQVRNIGQALVDDHDKWVKALQKIGTENNFTLPDKMDSRHKAMVDRAAAMSGPDFDRVFTREVSRFQRADLALLRSEMANGAIPALRTWARRCVPGLERRLEAVQAEQASLGVVTQKRP